MLRATTAARASTTMAFQPAASEKSIIFLRHGCTYMNEFLGHGPSFGEPNFTDVFPPNEQKLYRDSPLSPLGVKQATRLGKSRPAFCDDLELIVTSPLTRALQTFDLGVKQHLDPAACVPIIALPHASERLYLISDQGRTVNDLQQDYGHVDFKTGFDEHDDENASWWYQHDPAYSEWRPTGRGQRYACPGEPDHAFEERMMRLYNWLKERPESKIAVVCHWGVIDWFLDMDFDNCQWREIAFDQIQPSSWSAAKR